MSDMVVLGRRRFGETMRRDAWWVQPLVVFLASRDSDYMTGQAIKIDGGLVMGA